VTGHRCSDLLPLLDSLDVRTVENPCYREGMFSSVLAGLATIDCHVDAFFVLPVDLPLVRPATVRRLLQSYRQQPGADVIYPRFRGVRGHPPLINARHAEEIAAWGGEGGLRGALARWEQGSLNVDVADGYVLLDMDIPDDFRMLQGRAKSPDIPSTDECLALLQDVLQVKDETVRHGEVVARVAGVLGAELNRTGCCLDIALLAAAGLLHDIAKGEPDHALAGARLLREHGFGAVAGPVATHMDIAIYEDDELSAAEVIYLADKLVKGDRHVSIEERFRARMERHGDDPAILAIIMGRLEKALVICKRIESRLGRSLEEILTP
jgi:molybdenum cofactor cytidylyltransferase